MKYTFISTSGDILDEQLLYNALIKLAPTDVLVIRKSISEQTCNIKSMAERLGVPVELVKDPMSSAEKIIILGQSNDEVFRAGWQNL